MKTKDFLGNEWEIDCMGCAIQNRSMLVPGGFILRTQHFCVHQDPLVPLPGFLVIASLRHIQSIEEMDVREYEQMTRLVRITHRAIKQVTRIEELTLIQEESSRHFHLWFFPWAQHVIDRYGKPSLTKIRAIMSDCRKQPLSTQEWVELEKTIAQIRSVMEYQQ
jgi:diadenosine tetraphosphate (Ap4A) HIT family hydrolase